MSRLFTPSSHLPLTPLPPNPLFPPQCYAERQAEGLVPAELLDTGVNPAVFEVAGHLVLKRAEDYEACEQEAWADRLLAGVSLPEERFLQVSGFWFTVTAGAVFCSHGMQAWGRHTRWPQHVRIHVCASQRTLHHCALQVAALCWRGEALPDWEVTA